MRRPWYTTDCCAMGGKSVVGTRLKSSNEIFYHDRGFTCLHRLICHTNPEFTFGIWEKPRNPEILVIRQMTFTHEEGATHYASLSCSSDATVQPLGGRTGGWNVTAQVCRRDAEQCAQTLRVKTVSDASRAAVPPETPLDRRRRSIASSFR